MNKIYIEGIWDSIYSALVGMKITMSHLFTKNVTNQYPNVDARVASGTASMPPYARNKLGFDADACTACNLCAKACPVNCIDIESFKVVEGDPDRPLMKEGKPRKLWIAKYDINFAKCCYCGLCADACPFDALFMTDVFEYSTYDRKELLNHFSPMSADMIIEKKKMLAESQAKAKAEKALQEAEQA